jgi:hypothetical protein
MLEDGKTFVERRLTPRIKMTVRRTIAHWVAMSRTRRIIASLSVAAAIGGTTFGACRASDVTAPDFGSKKMGTSNLASNANLIGGTTSDHDSDSDNYPRHEARHDRHTDSDADADPVFRQSVETVFPVTEAVYNTCRNELVTLNGYLKQRMNLQTGPFGSTSYSLRTWKDTRGIYGEATVVETYWDEDSKSYKSRNRIVRYHNRESLLDRYDIGPFGFPMQSVFESKMRLQREGADPLRKVFGQGDDLYVFVKNRVVVDTRGTREEQTFRTECD